MSFDAYSTTQSDTKKSNIDFDAMNAYIVETANIQEPETLVGVVAGIVDLGTQEQPDAEIVFKGTPEDEEAEISKFPSTYFRNGLDPQTRKPARLKCYPVKPQQAVAIAVDFPDIILDKSQFFGNSNPQPLRMWLGGTFYMEGRGMVVARPTPLKVINIDKDAPKPKWSFSPLHLFYKMAIAAKLVKPGEVFLPNQIDQLIGKAFQFQAQIFMKDGKDGKQYLTENVKFVGGLGRGQSAAEIDNSFIVQFNKPNKAEDLKQLRNHVLNTIKNAQNYEGSNIQKELEAMQSNQSSPAPKDDAESPAKAPAKPVKAVKKPVVQEDDDSSDLPF